MGLLLATWLLSSMTTATVIDSCGVNPEQAQAALAAQRDAPSRAADADAESDLDFDIPAAALFDPLSLVGDEACVPTLDAYEQALRDHIPYEHRGLGAAALALAHADEDRLFRLSALRLANLLSSEAIVDARLRIARMREDERRLADPAQRAEPPRAGRVLARLAELDAVLGGGAPVAAAELRVPPNWQKADEVIVVDGPETEDSLLAMLPDAADALLASERPEAAFRAALDRQWGELVVSGTGSWRLLELGERAFGRERYRGEIEQAIQAIRVDERPAGRYAAIPLFGRWRPLPLPAPDAAADPNDARKQLQSHARALLWPQQMRLDRVIDCVVVQ